MIVNSIVAGGLTTHYFGRNDWAAHASSLKTIEDAAAIRSQIPGVFEQAERTMSATARESLLAFVIVGGVPLAWSWQVP